MRRVHRFQDRRPVVLRRGSYPAPRRLPRTGDLRRGGQLRRFQLEDQSSGGGLPALVFLRRTLRRDGGLLRQQAGCHGRRRTDLPPRRNACALPDQRLQAIQRAGMVHAGHSLLHLPRQVLPLRQDCRPRKAHGELGHRALLHPQRGQLHKGMELLGRRPQGHHRKAAVSGVAWHQHHLPEPDICGQVQPQVRHSGLFQNRPAAGYRGRFPRALRQSKGT